jgi:hypothetical protein
LKVPAATANEKDLEDEDMEGDAILDFLKKSKNPAKKRRIIVESYINYDFLVPTSNFVGRLFSIAKYVYTPQRQSMLPLNLEMLLFLRANAEIWDRNVVCKALKKAKTNYAVPIFLRS